MANTEILTKRMAINKANAQTVAVVAAAAFITVFCLFAAHAVWSQNSYQSRVISAKEKAHNQLVANVSAYSQLADSYEKFVSTPNNVIGGKTSGTGSNDGNNGKIILDALPPSYDFPALATTINNILASKGLADSTITGTDDQLNQQNNTSSASPQPVPMPFSFDIDNASYTGTTQLLLALQESIRPIQLDSMTLAGSSSSLNVNITAHTYYQPSKSISITKQVIK